MSKNRQSSGCGQGGYGFSFPPRAMSIDAAAYYVGQLSPQTFRSEMERHGIAPISLSRRRLGYLKEDLDAYLDLKAGKSSSLAVTEGEEWMEALENAN